MYDLAACMVTYNTDEEVLGKIISCFQKLKLNFKLFISDNSEKNGLEEFIKKFSDDRIEYIFNNSNNGFGAGHNIVIEKLLKEKKDKGENITKYHLIINPDIVFEEVGKFDERYFMYMEDYDLCRRIGEKFKVIYYPEAEIIHEHGKASYKSRKMMIIHSQSAIKYFNKWGWFFDKERHKKRKNFLK